MALFFDDDIKKQLALLINAPPQVLVDFCKLALDYVRNGPNLKRYEIAAQKLETSTDEIESCVTALLKLLLDGSKYSLSTESLVESATGAGFSREPGELLGRLYSAHGADLATALGELSSHAFHRRCRGLRWRLQAQTASRDVLGAHGAVQARALLSLRLGAGGCGPARSVPLQVSLPALVHVTGRLEEALRDSRTFHVRHTSRLLEQ